MFLQDVLDKISYSPLALILTLFRHVFLFVPQVQTVSARDPDGGGNGQFRYSIESGDPDDQFAIDGMTAFLSLI